MIGSVRDVSLDGYRAVARLSIADGHDIPVGTRAVIRRTSLLGEHFVDLVFPASFDPDTGPFLADDDDITDTETQADLEQLAQEATDIVGAISADDLAGVVHAGAEGLTGRGTTINNFVDDAALITDVLATQRADIAATIDAFAAVGATLAPASADIGAVIDELAALTATVAGGRDRMVATLAALVELARTTNEAVLIPHADRLATMFAQLNPVLGDLASRSDVLAGLVTDLLRFTENMPLALHDGQVLLLGWAFLDVPILQNDGFSDDPVQALLEFLAQIGLGG